MNEIHIHNQTATITVDFDDIRTRLKENPCWGADVLKRAGEYGWRVSHARKCSRGALGARIIDKNTNCLIAWGISGRKSCMAYRIERIEEYGIQITPLAYLARDRKIAMAVVLAMFYVVPVLLSPLLWWVYEVQILRASRVYLLAFCRYLEE